MEPGISMCAQTPGFTDKVLGWKRATKVTSGLRLQGNAPQVRE